MDENRAQAYLQLINTLLTCPSGEELEILQANSDLLDAEFLQVCEVVAENLAEEGNENAADFLRNLVSQLGEFVGRNEENMDDSEAENPREYLEFLQELLEAEKSYSGLAGVYPILSQRQHLLNARFAEILQQVSQKLIIGENSQTISSIIGLIENLSDHISEFPSGNRADNIEIAITGYQIVLNNREPGSEKWTKTQNNLAVAYNNRVNGSRAENV